MPQLVHLICKLIVHALHFLSVARFDFMRFHFILLLQLRTIILQTQFFSCGGLNLARIDLLYLFQLCVDFSSTQIGKKYPPKI